MCIWCDPEADLTVSYVSKEFHDGFLYPHGRHGYNPPEKIAEATANCPWCHPSPALGIALKEGL